MTGYKDPYRKRLALLLNFALTGPSQEDPSRDGSSRIPHEHGSKCGRVQHWHECCAVTAACEPATAYSGAWTVLL